MVNLGFVSNAAQLPSGFWTVAFRAADLPGNREIGATINGRTLRGGLHHFELLIDCPPGNDRISTWPAAMGQRLMDMDLTRFHLDGRSLSHVTGLPLTEALTAWGFSFFKHYAMDAVVLFHVGKNGEDRGKIYQAILAWTDQLDEVRFNPDLDYDTLAREARPSPRGLRGLLRACLSRRRANA